MMRSSLLLLTPSLSTQFVLHAQNLSLVGENYLTLNGERFNNKKIPFTKAEGDWYVKPDDAHATISLYTSFDARQLRLDLEWDGKSSSYNITDETRQGRKGIFFITLPDKDVYGDGLNSNPQEIKVTVAKLDQMNISFSVEGVAIEDGKEINVTGSFQLKKPVLKPLLTASYTGCDNTVYDKLTGAENRSPSDCESKFDMDVKTTFNQAFEKALNVLVDKRHFQIKNITQLVPLEGVERGSEKYITGLGTYRVELQLDPESEEGQAWYKKYNDAMEEVKTAGPSTQSMEKLMKLGYSVRINTQVNIVAYINSERGNQGDYKSEHKLLQVPGAVFAVQGSHVAARTGGGIENSLDATSIFIGRWKPGTIQKDSEGGSEARTSAYFDKSASLLSVQNMTLRFECSPELANEIISNLDINKLKSILH